MGSNGVDHLSKDLVEEGVSNQEVDMDFEQTGSVDESVVEKESADEWSNAGSFQEADDQNNSVQQSSVDESVVEKESADEQSNAGSFQEADDQNNSVQQSAFEISQSKELNVSSSPLRG
jgi:hypothetical protein